MGDGEDSDAALGTAGVADEVMAAAVVGVGYGGVYDLDETSGHCDVQRWLWFTKAFTKALADV